MWHVDGLQNQKTNIWQPRELRFCCSPTSPGCYWFPLTTDNSIYPTVTIWNIFVKRKVEKVRRKKGDKPKVKWLNAQWLWSNWGSIEKETNLCYLIGRVWKMPVMWMMHVHPLLNALTARPHVFIIRYGDLLATFQRKRRGINSVSKNLKFCHISLDVGEAI